MRWQPEIRKLLDEVLQTAEFPRIAVFDADGTLWHNDLGESFFKYQIQNHLAPGAHGIKDPWQHYENIKIRNHLVAYSWLAQINAKTPQAALKNQCESFYKRHFNPGVADEMRELIKELTACQFEVWICSASIRWIIDEAATDLGVPLDRVIAVETKVDSRGIITDEVMTPLPYKTGKKLCLERKLKELPTLVAGNSMGDLEMLTLAKKLSLVINFLPHLPEVRDSEESLVQEAATRGWPVQLFK